MRRLILGLAICLMPPTGHAVGRVMTLGGEVTLPVPQRWHLTSDSLNYPFRLAHERYPAELLIFKSPIELAGVIMSGEELKEAVQPVIDEVIADLPGAELLTSVGYDRGNHSSFVITFLSADSTDTVRVQHRFAGTMYRLPDGRQLLFTLWARAPEDVYATIETAFIDMQDNFRYTGPHTERVFGQAPRTWTWLVLAAVVIGLALLLRPGILIPRERRPAAHHTEWRCECGRIYSADTSECPECAQKPAHSTIR